MNWSGNFTPFQTKKKKSVFSFAKRIDFPTWHHARSCLLFSLFWLYKVSQEFFLFIFLLLYFSSEWFCEKYTLSMSRCYTLFIYQSMICCLWGLVDVCYARNVKQFTFFTHFLSTQTWSTIWFQKIKINYYCFSLLFINSQMMREKKIFFQ